MSCKCPEPRESADPRKAGSCIKCGKLIPTEVLSQENIVWFYDRLEACFPGKAPETFKSFRHECEVRELEGREKFGLSYLSRQNLREADQEGADGANYLFFDVLKYRRRTGRDDDLELALQGAYHAFKAFDCARRLEAKRRGSP